jgi:hypothetical protein
VQRAAASDEHSQAGTGPLQLGHNRGGREQMLEVVQHQQELALLKMTTQEFQHGLARRLFDPESLGDAHRDQRGIGEGRQVDHIDAVSECRFETLRNRVGEPRLTHPTRASQGQHAHVWATEQLADLGELGRAAHQRVRGGRQPVRA